MAQEADIGALLIRNSFLQSLGSVIFAAKKAGLFMRLGQLARKLALRQTEIVNFLLQHNIRIDDGSNTRLDDDHVALIMKQYAPAREDEVMTELATETDEEEQIVEAEEEIPLTPISPLPESTEEKPEVIRAQKIELSGLKVLGKIDLPEPRKKEEKTETEVPGDSTPVPEPDRKLHKTNRKAIQHKNTRREQQPTINPLALQREREAREAAEKRRVEREREKEKRKQHYHNKVKTIRPPKPAKTGNVEPVEQAPAKPQPKTWWGKFLKWLRPD